MFVLCIIINYTNSFSQNSDEWLKRGIDKIEAKKYFEALSDLSKAIALSPNSIDAYTSRAKAYSSLGNYNKALFDFNNQALPVLKEFKEE